MVWDSEPGGYSLAALILAWCAVAVLFGLAAIVDWAVHG